MNIKCDSLDPIKEFCQFGIEGCAPFVISYNKTSGMIFIHVNLGVHINVLLRF
jgi:uncharacterized protein YutD